MDGWVDGWVEGRESRVKDCLQQSKNLGEWVDGRKEGRVEGRESGVKDCLQQSTNKQTMYSTYQILIIHLALICE